MATVRINNYDFEAGGSIIHAKNMYMQKFIEMLGKYVSAFLIVQQKTTLISNFYFECIGLEQIDAIGDGSMGVWTGDEFICKGSGLAIKAQLFLRYGTQVPKLIEY